MKGPNAKPIQRVRQSFSPNDLKGEVWKMWAIECPGCGIGHTLTTKRPGHGPVWTFNHNLEKPTFRASLLVKWPRYNPATDAAEEVVCHSFITDGKIQYLNDCTHELAGQTVDLPLV